LSQFCRFAVEHKKLSAKTGTAGLKGSVKILAKQLISRLLLHLPGSGYRARAGIEHPEVLTVEITVGQWGVSFWYRQVRVAGNIACNWPRAL
jgi:hypothetical protein